jgi:uncharacterized surface protein with fasciclin (FAS1) repeats
MLQSSLHTAWTIFVPTNQAIWKQQQHQQQRQEQQNQQPSNLLATPTLQQFVLFHVCNQDYYRNELACDDYNDNNNNSNHVSPPPPPQQQQPNMIRMETGDICSILCDDQQSPEYLLGLGNNNNIEWPKFIEFDIAACNGVVHVLDGVLLSSAMV